MDITMSFEDANDIFDDFYLLREILNENMRGKFTTREIVNQAFEDWFMYNTKNVQHLYMLARTIFENGYEHDESLREIVDRLSTHNITFMRIVEIRKKTSFIHAELELLCKKVNTNVDYLEYEKASNEEEYIIIHYNNGYTKKVCITADSFKAITMDVLKEVS